MSYLPFNEEIIKPAKDKKKIQSKVPKQTLEPDSDTR